ncbi:hypothetical protein IMZ31_23220 (plasmid) [Pontibacillus sp. ALD_SL1]|uniref:hypothetical protein n=1 Tax=Pontibacillus sp. ALD_SL1 TaxID=2777185 RepID=UPI001A96006E|nr:hypothetical protein [Pontibacillus sp. ALD_SL1]QST02364.1 hypothetical protein IMZ31_23220 [Pontibacillus sp. ALD_SL1]
MSRRFLEIGKVSLRVPKGIFEDWMLDVYMKCYKKKRLKHIASNDKRIPILKITGDIFSVVLYVKDGLGREYRFFIDGEIFLNDLHIYSITLDDINPLDIDAHNAIQSTLKQLSSISQGYMYLSTNRKAQKLKSGHLYHSHQLLEEIYNQSDKNEETVAGYEWLITCLKRQM